MLSAHAAVMGIAIEHTGIAFISLSLSACAATPELVNHVARHSRLVIVFRPNILTAQYYDCRNVDQKRKNERKEGEKVM